MEKCASSNLADMYGIRLHPGDKVAFVEGRSSRVTGVVVAEPPSYGYPRETVAVRRDDGVKGGGEHGAWFVACSLLEKLSSGSCESTDPVKVAKKRIKQA